MNSLENSEVISKLQIFVKCRNLLQMDQLSILSAIVGVYQEDPATKKFHLIDQTEVCSDDLNPNFEKQFLLEHKVGTKQQYSFRVYDAGETRMVNEEHFIGSAVVNLDHLVEEHGPLEDSIYQLENSLYPDLDQELTLSKSTLFLRYRSQDKARDGKMKAELSFQCRMGDLTSFRPHGDINPVVAIFKRAPGPNRWQYLAQTEQSNDHRDPVFFEEAARGLWRDRTQGECIRHQRGQSHRKKPGGLSYRSGA